LTVEKLPLNPRSSLRYCQIILAETCVPFGRISFSLTMRSTVEIHGPRGSVRAGCARLPGGDAKLNIFCNVFLEIINCNAICPCDPPSLDGRWRAMVH
jgi:hypothetical protein